MKSLSECKEEIRRQAAGKERKKRVARRIVASSLAAAAVCVTVFIAIVVPKIGAGKESGVRQGDSGVQAQWEKTTFDEYLERTPYIFSGVCTDVRPGNPSGEVSLAVGRVYRGSIPDETVIIRGLSETAFSVGNEYLVFAGKATSVFLGYEYFGAETIVCDKGTGVYEGSIFGHNMNYAQSCRYVEEYVKNHVWTGTDLTENDYCRSENVADVFDYSTNVIVGKVTGIFLNVSDHSTCYTVTCERRLKGDCPDSLTVAAFKNSLTEDGEYVFLLTGENGSLTYTVSSKNSVFSPDSQEGKAIIAMGQ